MSIHSVRARVARFRFAAVIFSGVIAALASGVGGPLTAPVAVAAVTVPQAGRQPAGAGGPVIGLAALASFRGAGGPLAVNSSTGSVYVAEPFQKGLSVLDGQTGQVTATVTLADHAAWVAINPATNTIYAAVDQTVAVINGQDNTVTTTITDGLPAGPLAVDQASDTIYVTHAGSDSVTVIDGSTNTVTTTISTDHPEAAIAADPATDTSYAASSDGTISVIDGATNTVATTISAGADLEAIAVNPQTDAIYSGSGGIPGVITVIDGSSNTVTATVKFSANNLAVDPQTDTVYSTDEGGTVFALDGRTNNFVARVGIPVSDFDGSEPLDYIAVNPTDGAVYTAFNIIGEGGNVNYMGIVASCASGTAISAGTGCAKLAAGFQPSTMSFDSPAHGVILGAFGCGNGCSLPNMPVMMTTADGGRHWIFLPTPPVLGPGPETVLFTSPSDGWLDGALHTTDGGATWQQAAPIAGSHARLIAANATAIDSVVHLAGHHQEGLFTRPVGGVAWSRVAGIGGAFTDLAGSGHAAWLISKKNLWATSDGQHWHRFAARCRGAGFHLTRITAASPAHLALLCTRFTKHEVLTSADGGRTVHLAGPAPGTGTVTGFASPPGNPAVITLTEAAASGQPVRIYRSANQGRTWTAISLRFSTGTLSSVVYTNRTTGWIIVAGQSFLLHSTDAGRTWHKVTLS
jgi:YVTN family beta-propeller protein